MAYTDVEMVLATQLAYLDFRKKDGVKLNAKDGVTDILRHYGTMDPSTGKYVLRPGYANDKYASAQFETAQNIINISEHENCHTWSQWSIVDTCNDNTKTGFYGCLIDTNDGSCIVGARGSESYDTQQVINDWVIADALRINNPETAQEAMARKYINDIAKKYGDYNSYSFTGHSLGGELATHMAITAPESIKERMGQAISFDGPGYSDEYLKHFARDIEKVKEHISHYEYSWVGSLLQQPPGINNIVIRAHDDPNQTSPFLSQMWRHATTNIEFNEGQYVEPGPRGLLQTLMHDTVREFEQLPYLEQARVFPSMVVFIFEAYLMSVGEQYLKEMVVKVKEFKQTVNNLIISFQSWVVSGEYEVNLPEIGRMGEDIASLERQILGLSAKVTQISNTLPYDSVAGTYYRNSLKIKAAELALQGINSGRLGRAVKKARSKYASGDTKVSGHFH